MKPPLRIAILECDTPLEQVKKRFGSYGDVFTALLKSGADSLNEPDTISSSRGLEFSCYDVVNDMERYPDTNDIDAIFMTGSSTCIRELNLALE